MKESGAADGNSQDFRLDVVVAASGFGRKEMQVLQDVSRFIHEGIFIVTSFLSIWMQNMKVREMR
jgi:hypothetical protein